MTEHPTIWSYQELFDRVFDWVKEGEFAFEGTAETEYHCQLDDFLLKLFGFPHEPNRKRNTDFDEPTKTLEGVKAFDRAIERNELNLDWIAGPNGLTLFKMKIAQMESNT